MKPLLFDDEQARAEIRDFIDNDADVDDLAKLVSIIKIDKPVVVSEELPGSELDFHWDITTSDVFRKGVSIGTYAPPGRKPKKKASKR